MLSLFTPQKLILLYNALIFPFFWGGAGVSIKVINTFKFLILIVKYFYFSKKQKIFFFILNES